MTLPPEEVILKGAAAWNKWQEENKFPPHLRVHPGTSAAMSAACKSRGEMSLISAVFI